MKWFLKRLSENSTKTAVVTAVGAGIGLATGTVDVGSGAGAIIAALLAFLTPNNAHV